MKRTGWGWYVFLLAVLVGMVGCAGQTFSPPPQFVPEPIEKGMWTQKADNLVFVLDASSSMLAGHNGVEKFALAHDVVANFNQTIPDLKLQATVRSFGHDSSVSPASTMLLFGPADYSRDGVAQALGRVKTAGGPSPMAKALTGVTGDLKGAAGDIAVIVVSDGMDMGAPSLAVAGRLKEQFAGRLCLYTVLVGNDKAGADFMSKLGALTGCGGALNADEVATGAGMAAFVKRALLAGLADKDQDGVPDKSDRCPGTARGVAVDNRGCPKDSDGDGVYDYLDRCPDTPAGERVDKVGCPLPKAAAGAVVTAAGTWIFKDVQFENNRSDLKTSSFPVLDELVDHLNQNKDLRVQIQGHTDGSGTRSYNLSLSQKRADSVKAYLTGKGIAADRMDTIGYGPDRPISTNKTAKGRAENRRVEFKPLQ